MPVYWLQARDGTGQFKCQAPDPGQAFELLARSLRYNSFAAMSADLGVSPGDFELVTIAFEAGTYSEQADRRNVEREQQSLMQSMFKHLRRTSA